MNDLVAVTTIKYKENELSEAGIIGAVRAQAFLVTARNLKASNIPCVAIFDECGAPYLATLKDIGIILVQQRGTSMGSVRREAFRAASDMFTSATYFAWLEPEKPDIVRYLSPLMEIMSRETSTLGLFNRTEESMKSYGKLQAYYYLFCRSLANDLLGRDIDLAFGPMIVTRDGLREILSYNGEYGDKWDALFIPRLRMITKGMRVSILNIDFINYLPMNEVERRNIAIIEKRLMQMNNVTNALIIEWRILNNNSSALLAV